jgi:hypothetical protein
MKNAPAIDRGDQRAEFFSKTYINAAGTEGSIPLPGLIVGNFFSYIETKQESVQLVQSNYKIIFSAKDKSS